MFTPCALHTELERRVLGCTVAAIVVKRESIHTVAAIAWQTRDRRASAIAVKRESIHTVERRLGRDRRASVEARRPPRLHEQLVHGVLGARYGAARDSAVRPPRLHEQLVYDVLGRRQVRRAQGGLQPSWAIHIRQVRAQVRQGSLQASWAIHIRHIQAVGR